MPITKQFETKVLNETMRLFGREHQLRKLQEECAELIVAINHALNEKRSTGEFELTEEFVDVEIVMQQIKQTILRGSYKTLRETKIKRLHENIKKIRERRANGAYYPRF